MGFGRINLAEYNKIIKEAHKKTAREIMTHLKDTPVAKHLDVNLYKFIYQVILGIIGLVSLWYILVGRVDTNEREIGINAVYGEETRKIANKHIENTKGEPLTELGMTLAVESLEEDVNELFEDTKLNTEGRISHDKGMAVQALQNEVILGKLDEIIEKQ